MALGAVAAEDPEGETVTYSLAAGGGGRFAVGPSDGAVSYVGRGEDYESEPNRYELTWRWWPGHGSPRGGCGWTRRAGC